MNLTAVIAGATGLVGRHCLETLLADEAYERVVALVRRPLDVQHTKLETEVVEFDQLAEHPAWRCDVAFCALGTTIKTAGSQEAFRRVDFDFVRDFARWARAGGAETFVLVSSVGADPRSRNFYLRTKGEAERAVAEIGFRAVHIFRPSMLMGDRREFRLGEVVGTPVFRALSFLMVGGARKFRPVFARDVARAMVRAATTVAAGVQVHDHAEIVRLSGRG
jgi:uncharacterized protein YbjT (DUF2867 family)